MMIHPYQEVEFWVPCQKWQGFYFFVSHGIIPSFLPIWFLQGNGKEVIHETEAGLVSEKKKVEPDMDGGYCNSTPHRWSSLAVT